MQLTGQLHKSEHLLWNKHNVYVVVVNAHLIKLTFPSWGHILHWYFLPPPEDPLEVAPPPDFEEAVEAATAALIGWGTTSPAALPFDPVAGGELLADELLRWAT